MLLQTQILDFSNSHHNNTTTNLNFDMWHVACYTCGMWHGAVTAGSATQPTRMVYWVLRLTYITGSQDHITIFCSTTSRRLVHLRNPIYRERYPVVPLCGTLVYRFVIIVKNYKNINKRLNEYIHYIHTSTLCTQYIQYENTTIILITTDIPYQTYRVIRLSFVL